MLQLKLLEKQEQGKHKISRKKEIIKKINDIDTKKLYKESMK
jgi:hypothetical protein